MREIKFRAWDNEGMRMVTENELGEYLWVFQNGEIKILAECETAREQGGETVFINDWQPIDAHIMQFTGLHDRNGKEVFADDILKDSVGHLFRVYACIGGFAIKAEYWRSDLSDLIIGDELILTSLIDAQMQSYISGSVEIIGNRFENPELL